MNVHPVLLVPEVEADLRDLPASSAGEVLDAISALARDPTSGRRLRMAPNDLWELRLPRARVIYEVTDEGVRVLAIRPGQRPEDRPEVDRPYDFDVFVSYSHADATDLAQSLASALRTRELSVWFDRDDLPVGASLQRSLEEGVRRSARAVLILSPAYLKAGWPSIEMRALAAREAGGDRVVIPVWHNVAWDDVARFAPPLADRLAISSNDYSPEEIADTIARTFRGNVQGPPRPSSG